jgi:hypothetical protein
MESTLSPPSPPRYVEKSRESDKDSICSLFCKEQLANEDIKIIDTKTLINLYCFIILNLLLLDKDLLHYF